MIEEVLAGLGWDEGWQAAVDDVSADPSGRPGRVLRTHRVGYDVQTDLGREFCIHRARGRDPMAAPATGDWVLVCDVPDVSEPVIAAVLPRRTAVVRRDPADRAAPQVLAANADVVAVVQGADRPVNPRRLERQLALAHGSGAHVMIVVTKGDLPQADAACDAVQAAAPGEPLLRTAVRGDGIDQLAAATAGRRTLVLLGESGAGKSSLVNAVLGHDAVAVGGVREGDHKGRHTTTRRELLALPAGGALLDTPGVRAIGLWPGHSDVDAVFPEVAAAAASCRFADCSHDREPGCAVRQGVADGTIPDERLAAYHALVGELAATADEIAQKGWR